MKRIVIGLIVALSAVVVLSSAASYPTSIKSFTTRVAGDTIQPGHINDLQDEVTAIETDLLKAWTAVSHSAANFTASAGTWTVDAGEQVTYAYIVKGKTMTLVWDLTTTDVSTGGVLRLAIPSGYIAAVRTSGVYIATDNGGSSVAAMCRVLASGTYVELYATANGGSFAATAGDNTTVAGQLTFEVQ